MNCRLVRGRSDQSACLPDLYVGDGTSPACRGPAQRTARLRDLFSPTAASHAAQGPRGASGIDLIFRRRDERCLKLARRVCKSGEGWMARYRLGVDVGGTNTDLVLHDELSGAQFVEKLPTTPSNPAVAVLEGVGRFVARGISPREIGFFAQWYDGHHQCAPGTQGCPHRSVYHLFLALPASSWMCRTQTRSGTCSTIRSNGRCPGGLRSHSRNPGPRRFCGAAKVEPLDLEAVRSGAEALAAKGNPIVRRLLHFQLHNSCP